MIEPASVLAQLPDAVVVADAEPRVMYVNPATERLLGAPADHYVGRHTTEMIPPRLRAAHAAGFQRFVRTGTGRLVGRQPVRVAALRHDGTELDVELSLAATRDGAGNLLVAATLRDVSDVIALERQLVIGRYLRASMDVALSLQKSERIEDAVRVILPALCEHLDWDVAGLWLPDDGTLHCADFWAVEELRGSSFETMSRGYRFRHGEGLPGRCWSSAEPLVVAEIGAGGHFPRLAAAREVGLRTGVAFPLIGSHGVRGVVEFFGTESGDVDPDLLDTLLAIGRQLGQFLERVHTEEELRRSEQRYRSLVEATTLDVWRAEPSGALVEDMPRWRRFTGQRADELLGSGWLDAVHPDDRDRVAARWQQAVAEMSVYETEYRISTRDGASRIIAARGVPITEDGAVREWIGTSIDVTESRETERAMVALAETLQRSLLPPHLPDVPRLDLAARYLAGGQAMEVGGDFYDVFATGPTTWTAVIGDVCGKGAEAATVTALARYTIRAAAIHATEPSQVLRVLNEALLRQEAERPFLTAALLQIRFGPDGVFATVSCGGHPAPVHVSASGAVGGICRSGTLLGVLEEVQLHDIEVPLAAGDLVVLFTDGVTEARDRERREFGEERLVRVLRACAGRGAEETLDEVLGAMHEHTGQRNQDDVALLALRLKD